MGSALREQAKENTPLGRKLDEIVNKKGELVSNEIMAEVLNGQIKKVSSDKGVIVDGTPRRENQINEVEDAFNKAGRKIDKVIFINLSEEKSVERISKRAMCQDCNEIFILGKDLKNINEGCPKCKGVVSQREDDTPEAVKKRLDIFNNNTMPVIEYFREKDRLLEIDGSPTVKEVLQEIINKLG